MVIAGIGIGGFPFQMFKNALNHRRILDAGNHFDVAAAVLADFNLDVEDSFEALHDFQGWNECRLCMEQKPVQVIAL